LEHVPERVATQGDQKGIVEIQAVHWEERSGIARISIEDCDGVFGNGRVQFLTGEL